MGEQHATFHRRLTELLDEGIVGRFNHGTVHLPSSGRYCLTTQGIRETADFLDYDTHSDFVRACPMSREWLTLLLRRMDAVAAFYRLAGANANMPGPASSPAVAPCSFPAFQAM